MGPPQPVVTGDVAIFLRKRTGAFGSSGSSDNVYEEKLRGAAASYNINCNKINFQAIRLVFLLFFIKNFAAVGQRLMVSPPLISGRVTAGHPSSGPAGGSLKNVPY